MAMRRARPFERMIASYVSKTTVLPSPSTAWPRLWNLRPSSSTRSGGKVRKPLNPVSTTASTTVSSPWLLRRERRTVASRPALTRPVIISPSSRCRRLEARPEPTSVAGAYLPKPNLRVRFPGEESIRGRDLVTVDLVVSCFDVDEGIFSLIVSGEAWQHLALVDLVAAPGELLFAIPGSRGCRSHEFILLACNTKAPQARANHTSFGKLPGGPGWFLLPTRRVARTEPNLALQGEG